MNQARDEVMYRGGPYKVNNLLFQCLIWVQ